MEAVDFYGIFTPIRILIGFIGVRVCCQVLHNITFCTGFTDMCCQTCVQLAFNLGVGKFIGHKGFLDFLTHVVEFTKKYEYNNNINNNNEENENTYLASVPQL